MSKLRAKTKCELSESQCSYAYLFILLLIVIVIFVRQEYNNIQLSYYLRQQVLRSVVFVGWFVRVFVREFEEQITRVGASARSTSHRGAAGARATCSRT